VSSLVNESYGPDHFADPSLAHWRLRMAWAVDALTARLATRMHAVSVHVADEMAHRLRYPRDRIDVVHRGRRPSDLRVRTGPRRARAREELGIDAEPLVVLAVGRQEHQKGLDTVIRSMPRIAASRPGARLLIAGRAGAHTSELETLAAPLGNMVSFLGTRD